MDHLLPVPMSLDLAGAVAALRGRFLVRPGRIGPAPVVVLTGSEVEVAEARTTLGRIADDAALLASIGRCADVPPVHFRLLA